MTGYDVHELEVLLGAYALDAVEPEERAAVEAHLDTCPRCRAELADHREVAALLGNLPEPAPEGLWTSIAAAMEGHVLALDMDLYRRARQGELPPPAPFEPAATSATGGGPTRAGDRQPPWWRAVAGLAVAAALALIAVLGLEVVRQDDRIDALTEQVAAFDVDRAASQALADPANAKVVLTSPTDPGVSATAVVTPAGAGYLVATDLPALPSDRTYQLWGVGTGGPISLGVLGSHPSAVAFSAGGHGNFAAFAISDEVAGGVAASANQPVVVGEAR